jgi:hypothetical protein
MSGKKKTADSRTLRVTVSKESFRLLREIAIRGVYGRTEAEVAARFIEKRLEDFTEPLKFKLQSSEE